MDIVFMCRLCHVRLCLTKTRSKHGAFTSSTSLSCLAPRDKRLCEPTLCPRAQSRIKKQSEKKYVEGVCRCFREKDVCKLKTTVCVCIVLCVYIYKDTSYFYALVLLFLLCFTNILKTPPHTYILVRDYEILYFLLRQHYQ